MPTEPMIKTTCALACAVAPLVAVAAPGPIDVPSPFDATYQGSKRVLVLTARGEARLRLQRTARHLVYTMDTRVGLGPVERRFHDCSVLRIEGTRMLPLQHVHLDASEPKHDVRSRFDWAASQVTTRLGVAGTPVVQPVTWPTWDAMSLQLVAIGSAPHRADGAEDVHRVLDRGVPTSYRVRFGATQPTPQGAQREVVSRKEGSERSVVLLLGEQPVWQPLRITLEGVSFERSGAGASAAPAAAASAPADEPVPQCRDSIAP